MAEVWMLRLVTEVDAAPDAPIQTTLRCMARSRIRAERISGDVLELVRAGRRVLLATGRLIGEGFDDPRFDALVLALSFSWKGTLQQYVGRLSRPWPVKPQGLVLDYLDAIAG